MTLSRAEKLQLSLTLRIARKAKNHPVTLKELKDNILGQVVKNLREQCREIGRGEGKEEDRPTVESVTEEFYGEKKWVELLRAIGASKEDVGKAIEEGLR